ncbi:MAG: hypothetical protein ACR2RE_13590 [Geminicoccaceae bacterium]
MSSFETDLTNFVNSIDALTEIGTRLYWSRAPSRSASNEPLPPPYIVADVISYTPDQHQQGTTGNVNSVIQFDCYGQTYPQASAMHDALEANLDGWRNTQMGDTPVSYIELQNSPTYHNNPQHGNEIGTFRRSVDFVFVYCKGAINHAA